MMEIQAYETTEMIRMTCPGIPVIALTAFDLASNDENLLNLFDNILIKQIMTDDLLRKIIVVL